MKQTEITLNLNGREIILIGTAHVSAESVEEVKAAVEQKAPDCVAVELDEQRLSAMRNPDSWKKLDIISVLKKNQGLVLLANLVLASFQKRMGANVGVKPGDEMRAALDAAESRNIPVALVDRPIQTTLRRAWAKNSLWGKCKLLSAMLASAFSKEEVSGEEIENLKDTSEMDSMMAELSEYLPSVKEVLIDERDFYLASHIWQTKGNRVLAVLGAGHLPGVQKQLALLAEGIVSPNTDEIAALPPKSLGVKIAVWLLPLAIAGLVTAGFVFGGAQLGKNMVWSWILWNGILAACGTILAGGNPLAVLAALVSAPFTSLCPFIGVGFVAGIVQALVTKPAVQDMETLHDDASSIKGFYRNRILRVLLVLILSSIGSSIGTFVAGARFVVGISALFDKIGDAVMGLIAK